jgi:hypothetical protein
MNIKHLSLFLLLFTTTIIQIPLFAKKYHYLGLLKNSNVAGACSTCQSFWQSYRLFRNARQRSCDLLEGDLRKVHKTGVIGQQNFIISWLLFPINATLSLCTRDVAFLDRDIKFNHRKEEHRKAIETILPNATKADIDKEEAQIEQLADRLRTQYLEKKRK